jgi:hypothetical protein
MSSVSRFELGEDIFHVSFHSFKGDAKGVGDDLVAPAACHVPQDFDLAGRERVGRVMLSDVECYAGRNALAPGMDCANRLEQFLADGALKEIARRAGLECASGLGVTPVSGQHDKPRAWKFATDGHDRLDAARARHLQIHERDIGPVRAKGLDRFTGIFGFCDQRHVGLMFQQGCDPLSDDGMVVDCEDRDGPIGSFHG